MSQNNVSGDLEGVDKPFSHERILSKSVTCEFTISIKPFKQLSRQKRRSGTESGCKSAIGLDFWSRPKSSVNSIHY
jgi:hypothetical protein